MGKRNPTISAVRSKRREKKLISTNALAAI
jgi:hypothetical protein